MTLLCTEQDLTRWDDIGSLVLVSAAHDGCTLSEMDGVTRRGVEQVTL